MRSNPNPYKKMRVESVNYKNDPKKEQTQQGNNASTKQIKSLNNHKQSVKNQQAKRHYIKKSTATQNNIRNNSNNIDSNNFRPNLLKNGPVQVDLSTSVKDPFSAGSHIRLEDSFNMSSKLDSYLKNTLFNR